MKRPVVQYACLLALLIIAVIYQVRMMEFRMPQWFPHAQPIYRPLVLSPEPLGLAVSSARSSVHNAGIRDGDILLAIDGKPLTGIDMYAQAVERAQGGQKLRFTVLAADRGRPAPRTVTYAIRHHAAGISAYDVVVYLIAPVFCLAFGFWVAAVRPRDHLAWLLLALMLSFAVFGDAGTEFWGPGLTEFGTAYHEGLNSTWPLWILLFGMYFPEPFPARVRNWLAPFQWALVALLTVSAALRVAVSAGALRSYSSVAGLIRFLAPFHAMPPILAYVAVSAFFACIWTKGSMAVSRDAKRRLHLLYLGATISLAPLFILVVISKIAGVTLEIYFPSWLTSLAVFVFFLFPLTLAYVIVVHKAMDVRVVIRQGLQYALAKNGILALRIIIIGLLIFFMILTNIHLQQYRILPWIVVAAGVALIALTREPIKRLRAWTDRRFFRDAYNAELVLSELGEKVRTIVEPRPLMDTVCRTIAGTLHVPNIAVLLRQSAEYRPAYALGYGSGLDVAFPDASGTVRQLAGSREPARVYLDDRSSWVYRTVGLTEDEREKLGALRAQLLLPLSVRDKLLGFMSLSEKRSAEPYSGSDLRLLKSVAAQTGLALENAQLSAAMAQEVAQREKLSRELEIAREVQERLFPQKLPPVPGLDYCGTCRTALGVGGDYFDFLALPGGRLGMAIGDVSGKGIAAALMMASLQASLRSEAARADYDLSGLMANVNHMVYEASASNRYATFFYSQYDPESRLLTYVNAGHNPPIILNSTANHLKKLETGGTVIGLLEHVRYAQDQVKLEAGDVLIAYTDGITESMNPEDEEWGEKRFMAAVESAMGASAAEIAASIVSAAIQFAAGAPQHDDMTLVILRVLP
jgi:phosphoserine phosphatase RsbU/P